MLIFRVWFRTLFLLAGRNCPNQKQERVDDQDMEVIMNALNSIAFVIGMEAAPKRLQNAITLLS